MSNNTSIILRVALKAAESFEFEFENVEPDCPGLMTGHYNDLEPADLVDLAPDAEPWVGYHGSYAGDYPARLIACDGTFTRQWDCDECGMPSIPDLDLFGLVPSTPKDLLSAGLELDSFLEFYYSVIKTMRDSSPLKE